MTYGQLKLRISQMFPAVGIEIIEGFINDRYQEILVELPWTRQTVEAVLQTTAPYSTGTVAVVQGSASLTLTGGSWTASMNGRAFRVKGRAEFYAFGFVGSSAGNLDRPYEGPNNSAASYAIAQHVYPLPLHARLLDDNAFSPLRRFDHAELSAMDPWRQQTGMPAAWASYMDDASVPPRMQVELLPVPDKVYGLPYRYTADADPLTSTSTIVQVWMQPAALVDGVVARIKAQLKDYAGAQFHAAVAENALKKMRAAEAQGMAPARMTLDRYYTGYRDRRGDC